MINMGVIKTITITEEQNRFIGNQSRHFKLSRFVRSMLDDYMKFVDGLNLEEKEIERVD